LGQGSAVFTTFLRAARSCRGTKWYIGIWVFFSQCLKADRWFDSPACVQTTLRYWIPKTLFIFFERQNICIQHFIIYAVKLNHIESRIISGQGVCWIPSISVVETQR
jgi:hypothetical protein